MDIERLVERDGWLYICWESTHLTEPKRFLTYWPLQVRFTDFARRFTSDAEARQFLGCQVQSLGSGCFRDNIKFWTYRLPYGGQTTPEFNETEEVPQPKQRGKKRAMRWYDGRWQKETSRGWVAA